MSQLSGDFWNRLSEEELWTVAMNPECAPNLRAEAMDRWLFPSDYDYPWATVRLDSLRRLMRGKRDLTPPASRVDRVA